MVQYELTNNNNDDKGPTFGFVYENGYVDTTSTVSFRTFTLDDVQHGIKATELKKLQQTKSYNSVL